MDILYALFRSKIRQKILVRFFADESKRFYINEMARLVSTTQGTCRREMNKLVDMGILTTLREGNLQYYQLDKVNPLYKEFRAIVQKTIGIEAILRKAIQVVEGIAYAFIFGSYAKKEFDTESDIDIVVIGDIKEAFLMKTLKDTEKTIGREINYHIYTEKEFKEKLKTNSFIQNIIKNYIMLVGNERKFRELFKKA
jgi:predicted nucleotidyltransferase